MSWLNDGEEVTFEQVHDAPEIGVTVDDRLWIVLPAHSLDFLDRVTEEEEVVGPHLLADLHVGAVEGADGEGAVERELHVAGPRSLHTGGRDLLGDVGRGDDLFGQRDAVVGHEGDANPSVDHGVVVHHVGDAVDEADDELRHVVRSHQRVAYAAMFSCAYESLKKLANDKRFIGSSRIGMLGAG